jgi:mRNA interferase RelE/StbE
LDSRIQSLANDPRPAGCKKLKSGRYDNLYRIREGDWRILYAIEDDRIVVLILDVVRRDQAYR